MQEVKEGVLEVEDERLGRDCDKSLMAQRRNYRAAYRTTLVETKKCRDMRLGEGGVVILTRIDTHIDSLSQISSGSVLRTPY